MRIIQFQIREQKKETVKEILEGDGIDYVITPGEGSDGDVAMVKFPIPRQGVEPVLNELREAGIDVDEQFRLNFNANVARTGNLETLIKRFVNGKAEGDYLPHEELKATARDLNPSITTYYVMTILGVIVATAGLLLNSSAVVVGSMVLAPQLGAALTASVGIVTNTRDMIEYGLKSQVTGLGLGVLGGAVFGFFLRWLLLVPPNLNITALPEISGRISPGFLSIAIAMAAGIAAAFSLATHDSPAGPLVGVMVSAALIPAAATAGIGIAWGLSQVILGAMVLLIVNVVMINVMGPLVFWLLGYRPNDWDGVSSLSLRSARQYSASIFAALLLVSGASVAGAMITQQVDFERRSREAIADVLESNQYDGLELRDVSTEYVNLGVRNSPQKVNVVVGNDGSKEYSGLGTTLRNHIANETGVYVIIEMEYVQINQTNPNGSESTTGFSSVAGLMRYINQSDRSFTNASELVEFVNGGRSAANRSRREFANASELLEFVNAFQANMSESGSVLSNVSNSSRKLPPRSERSYPPRELSSQAPADFHSSRGITSAREGDSPQRTTSPTNRTAPRGVETSVGLRGPSVIS